MYEVVALLSNAIINDWGMLGIINMRFVRWKFALCYSTKHYGCGIKHDLQESLCTESLSKVDKSLRYIDHCFTGVERLTRPRIHVFGRFFDI